MNNYMKNLKFNRTIFSTQLIAVGIILSAVFFLLLIDSAKTYRSEISIMINAKSDVAAKQQLQIVSNIMEFPKTLSFYDRMLAINPDMRDVTAGQSKQQRKETWNEMLTVERASFDASVIKVAITTSREADSVQLANKTVRTLFDTSAFYYNVKKDVDLRIIDGPITRVQVSNLLGLFLLSIFLGFAVSGLLQRLSASWRIFGSKKISLKKPDFSKLNSFFDFKKNPTRPIEQELESLSNLYQDEQAEAPFVFEQEIQKEAAEKLNINEKFQEIKKITKKLEPGKYPNFPEMPATHTQSSSAPDNLPIADDSYFAQYSKPTEIIQSETLPIKDEIAIDTAKEPTPEELKKRLNELLRGKI